jgi:hypothetical protein
LADAVCDGGRGQQAVQPVQGEGAGFDGARCGFQRGVATASRGTGEVGGGGDIGAGQGGQTVDEGGALAGHVAAVDQDVGVGAEVAADGGEFAAEVVKVAGVQKLAADHQLLGGAVTDEVQGRDVVARAQGFGDLLKAGTGRVENQYFAPGGQACDEFLPATD